MIIAIILNPIITGIPQPEKGIISPDKNNKFPAIVVALVTNCIMINVNNETGKIPAIAQMASSGKKGNKNIKNMTTFSFPFILVK